MARSGFAQYQTCQPSVLTSVSHLFAICPPDGRHGRTKVNAGVTTEHYQVSVARDGQARSTTVGQSGAHNPKVESATADRSILAYRMYVRLTSDPCCEIN